MIHPWLEKYPIRKGDKYLIIGTHPPMPYCGKLDYYYGNMSEFWRFIDKVYSGYKLYENGSPKIEDILKFLKKGKLAITDIILKTHISKFSTDKDMGNIGIQDLNQHLFKWLKDSSIETIYFTSFGSTNSAKILFKKWYKSNFKHESQKYKITKNT